jgi:hypothetical protein
MALTAFLWLFANSTSTRVPFASCSAEEYSAGLWLIPRRLGTKTIPLGQSGTMNCASWKAPDGIRLADRPCAAARRRPRR